MFIVDGARYRPRWNGLAICRDGRCTAGVVMARCRQCKKAIKLLEVLVDTPHGEQLRWRAFDKRRRAGEPYHPHDCPKEKHHTYAPASGDVVARRPYKED